jgi:hypothetical protein
MQCSRGSRSVNLTSHCPNTQSGNQFTRRSRFDPWQRQNIFPLVCVSRPALGPIQPPAQWVPGVKRGWGVMLTTHHLMPRSYTSSPPHPAPPYVCCGTALFLSVDKQRNSQKWYLPFSFRDPYFALSTLVLWVVTPHGVVL